MNECLVNNGNCSDICVNDSPYYHCDCPDGGQLDPTNLNCVFNAVCQPGPGSGEETVCECLPGYQDISTNGVLNCTGRLHRVGNFSITALTTL